MVNKAVEGLVGNRFEFPVERGKVMEFLEATGGDPDVFGPWIPPTYLTSAFFWEARVHGADVKEAIGFDPSRSVHAEQEFRFHGPPPRLGDQLTATSRVDRIYEKTNRAGKTLTFVDVVTDFCDDAGQLRAEAIMRALEFPHD